MRKLVFLLILMSTLSFISQAQGSGNFLMGANLDIFKTDYDKAFNKAQIGIELNYFLKRNFSITGGIDIWIQGQDSFVLGMRWYPFDFLFTRFRGLIGANELAFGVGYRKPISENFSLEGMFDYYINPSDLGFRIGITYLID